MAAVGAFPTAAISPSTAGSTDEAPEQPDATTDSKIRRPPRRARAAKLTKYY